MNQREIKFRAWDKTEKRMKQPESLCHLDGELSKNIHSSLIPLQFTGLYDKNGKEIYEGDVISTHIPLAEAEKALHDLHVATANPDFQILIAEIVFREGTLAFELKRLNRVDDLKGCPLRTFYTHNEVASLEVIGNIYENPELLSNANIKPRFE